MKKLLFLLVAVIGLGISSAYAGGKCYTVIITYKFVYHFIDGRTTVGSQEGTVQSTTFTIYADTPDQAESQAKNQCDTTCSTNYPGTYQGQVQYNGKLCDKYKQRVILTARAQ